MYSSDNISIGSAALVGGKLLPIAGSPVPPKETPAEISPDSFSHPINVRAIDIYKFFSNLHSLTFASFIVKFSLKEHIFTLNLNN